MIEIDGSGSVALHGFTLTAATIRCVGTDCNVNVNGPGTLAGAMRTVLQITVVLILMATMMLWVRLNRVALELQGRRQGSWREVAVEATGSGAPAGAPSPPPGRTGRPPRVLRRKWGRDGSKHLTVLPMPVRGSDAYRAAAPGPP